jgi:Domain of unknown function (DUF4168)
VLTARGEYAVSSATELTTELVKTPMYCCEAHREFSGDVVMNLSYVAERTIVLIAACACIVTLDASAQVPADQLAPPDLVAPLPPDATPIEEEKIDQFADAYLVIEEIHTKAASDLEKADDPEQASEIRANAEGMIIQAVERSGLELDEFNRIAELMSVDRELRERIASRVAERRRI